MVVIENNLGTQQRMHASDGTKRNHKVLLRYIPDNPGGHGNIGLRAPKPEPLTI